MSRSASGIVLALTVLAGAHGALAATAPVIGYPGAGPPGSPSSRGRELLPTRATWSQLPARIAGEADGWKLALEYTRLCRLLGLETGGRVVLEALSRKLPVQWVQVVLAEIGPSRRGWRPEPVVVAGPPALVLHAALRDAAGALLAGAGSRRLAAVGRAAALIEDVGPAPVPLPTRMARIRLLAVLDPIRARQEAWSMWVRAWRERRSALAAESLALVGVTDRSAHPSLLTIAIAKAQLHEGARRVFPWLLQLRDAGVDAQPEAGACLALPVAPAAHRFDCELARFEGAWRGGRWADAFTAFRSLDRGTIAELPAPQQLRAAVSVLPFLDIIGEWGRFQRWQTRAMSLARASGDEELVGRLTLALAAGMRIAGRAVEARRTLDRLEPAADAHLRRRLLVEGARLASAGGRASTARDLVARAVDLTRRGDEQGRLDAALAALDVAPGVLTEADFGWLHDLAPPDAIPGPLWRALVQGRRAEAAHRWRAAADAYRRAWSLVRAARDEEVERRIGLMLLRRRIAERRATIALRTGRPRDALDAIEAGRVSDGLGEGTWRHLGSHVRADDLVVAFARVDGALWAWRVSEGRVDARRLAVDAARLTDLARLWSAATAAGTGRASWERIGERLADLLLGPVLEGGWSAGKARLLVALAPGLQDVPFDVLAELAPGGDGVARDGVVTAPSLAALDGSWHRRPLSGRAVVFVPRTGAASLAEARIVGATLGGRTYLGREATKARFRTATEGAAIVHFGGHSEAPGPLLQSGGLTLRPLTTTAGILRYQEIAGLHLEGSTVVLLGCDTAAAGAAGERFRPAEMAASSLAEAFFRAGSRAVVGSLWAIDDPAARDIAREFYAAGGPRVGPAALAVTKRRLRRLYPDDPARWAGLVWQGAPPS